MKKRVHETIELALSQGLISNDDAKLLSQLLNHSIELASSPHEYLSSIGKKRKALQLAQQKNRYSIYLNEGRKRTPRLPSGRLDWRAKEEYEQIQTSLDKLMGLEELTAQRFAKADQTAATLFNDSMCFVCPMTCTRLRPQYGVQELPPGEPSSQSFLVKTCSYA